MNGVVWVEFKKKFTIIRHSAILLLLLPFSHTAAQHVREVAVLWWSGRHVSVKWAEAKGVNTVNWMWMHYNRYGIMCACCYYYCYFFEKEKDQWGINWKRSRVTSYTTDDDEDGQRQNRLIFPTYQMYNCSYRTNVYFHVTCGFHCWVECHWRTDGMDVWKK